MGGEGVGGGVMGRMSRCGLFMSIYLSRMPIAFRTFISLLYLFPHFLLSYATTLHDDLPKFYHACLVQRSFSHWYFARAFYPFEMAVFTQHIHHILVVIIS